MLFFGGREATTGNASAVRRLSIQSIAEVLQKDNFVILSRLNGDSGWSEGLFG